MTKILFHSNAAWANGGYGAQTRITTPRLKKLGYDIAISAFYGLLGSRIKWKGMWVYPRHVHDYGNDVIIPHSWHFFGQPKQGLLITLVDAWIFDPQVMQQVNWLAWLPIDHDPAPPPILRVLSQSNALPIAFSKFGVKALQDGNINPFYVPHGIETEVFQPKDKLRARKRLKLPESAFIVGVVAANKGKSPSRKSFQQIFEAFAEFRRRHGDALMYLHTEVTGVYSGVALRPLAETCGIPQGAIKIVDQYQMMLGLPDRYLAEAYSALDVLLNPSMGEGFGLTPLEAEACGTPTIVGANTAQPELCVSGWLVPGTPFYTPLDSWQFTPIVGEIIDRLEDAYKALPDPELSRRCREFALTYDADLVMRDCWQPTLAKITEVLGLGQSEKRPDLAVRASGAGSDASQIQKVGPDQGGLSPLPPLPVKRPESHRDASENGLEGAFTPEDLVSVIVPTRDATSKIAQRCFRALAKSDYPYELIVVQRELDWTFASVINQGIRAAKGGFILLLNDDCFVQKMTIRSLVGTAKMAPNIGVVGGLLLYPDGRIQHAGGAVIQGGRSGDVLHLLQGQKLSHKLSRQSVDYVTAAMMLIKRSVIESHGGLDERYTLCYEDSDFCARVRKAGSLVIFDPRAKAIHLESATRGQEPSEAIVSSRKLFGEEYQ